MDPLEEASKNIKRMRRMAIYDRCLAAGLGGMCIYFTWMAFSYQLIFTGILAAVFLGLAWMYLNKANETIDSADQMREQNDKLRRLRGDATEPGDG